MICMCSIPKVPLLNRSIYMLNKTLIGKVDDVFGTVSAPGIAIALQDGVKGESFKAGDKVSLTVNFNYPIYLETVLFTYIFILIGLHR